MDRIRINKLGLEARQGEAVNGQIPLRKFRLSADLYPASGTCRKNDDPTAAVRYKNVCDYMESFMKSFSFRCLETAAGRLSEGILTEFPEICKAELEIENTWQFGLDNVESVSAFAEREWHTVYIGIGSNVGNRDGHIKNAIARLKMRTDCRVDQESMIIECRPYGNVIQDDFLNGCILLRTWMTPEELLSCLRILEDDEGGSRADVQYGPRALDLDILLYDDLVYESDDLIIPHIDMENRRFELEPLADIAPNRRHPIFGMTMLQMLEELTDDE